MKSLTRTRGVSMLLVMLIASIVLLTSLAVGAFALRAVRSAGQRSEAVRALYTAEDAVGCVKYWLRKDVGNIFSNSQTTIKCNNSNITVPAQTADSSYATTKFTILADTSDTNLGGVDVTVIRDLTKSSATSGYFVGKIRVEGFSDDKTSSNRTSERFQEYDYQTATLSDVMLVVDRSGSIDGPRVNGSEDATSEWGQLIAALRQAVDTFRNRTPQPYLGIVTFGTGTSSVGVGADPGSCSGCVRIPEVLLQPLASLATDAAINDVYSNAGKAHTNLSLGMSVAAAELMKKYYPAGPVGSGIWQGGTFEKLVETGDLSSLPDNVTSQARPAADDYIIIITDGEPNALIRSIGASSEPGPVTCNWYENDTANLAKPSETRNLPGSEIVFHVNNQDSGCLNEDTYTYCNDTGDEPANDNGYPSNIHPNQAKCNAQLTAEAIHRKNITIAAIGVGIGDTNKNWLRQKIVSNPLFYADADYGNLGDVIISMLETLDLIEIR